MSDSAIREAAARWARSVFGGPRAFNNLIVGIDIRDEYLERIATEVIRREVREERRPCADRALSNSRLFASQVDPFSISLESLRLASEYVASCSECGGGGAARCPLCAGDQRTRCRECKGSGKVPGKRNNLIKCKVCRASGTVPCSRCGANGTIACPSCGASGRQVAWLTYDQTSKWMLSVAPQSPVLAAHRQLNEARFLSPDEFAAFSVEAKEESTGAPVDSPAASDRVASVVRSLDRRLERIARQQYLKLAVVRRDVRFAMCGVVGTLVLSGKELAATTTADAVRPIRRRFNFWWILLLLLFIASGALMSAAGGASTYFATANSRMSLLRWIGVLLAIPAIGGVLRSLRPGWSFAPLRISEKLTGLGSTAALVLVPVVGFFARPSFADVDKALASHNVAQAKIVLEALREGDGANARLSDAADAIALVEATAATGNAKLALLDAVVSHHGARAQQAAAASREAKLAEIQRALDSKTPDVALKGLNQWFSQGVPDTQVAELRARAEDLAFVACADDPCRFAAAVAAKGAASTPEREARVVSTRQGLLLALTTADVPGEDALSRVNRLRALSATAVTAAGMTGADPELIDLAKKTEKWAQSGLAAVPFLGSQVSVVLALLGGKPAPTVPGKCVVVETNLICVSLDAQSRCKGVYVVGAEGSRKLQGTAWSPDRIVSQAVGRAAAAPVPSPMGAAVTTRFDSGAPVLARWSRGELRELRIGDATP